MSKKGGTATVFMSDEKDVKRLRIMCMPFITDAWSDFGEAPQRNSEILPKATFSGTTIALVEYVP